MEDFIYYNNLYLIYKDLLNENIQEVFDLYYGENLSMQDFVNNHKKIDEGNYEEL